MEDINRSSRNDNAMIRWICSKRLADRVPTEHLRRRIGIHPIEEVVRLRRLRWYGHVQRMRDDSWPKKVQSLEVDGRNSRGRPKKRWCDNIRDDYRKRNLATVNVHDRQAWRSAIRPDRHSKASNPRNTGNTRTLNVE